MELNPDKPIVPAALRQRAEKLARKTAVAPPEGRATRSPAAMRHALHELRVHQIELEMQNEELRRTQAELDASRSRYFDLFDLAPVGYVTLSEQGLILESNLAAAALLGVARADLVKKPISRFIAKEDHDIHFLHRRKLLETGDPQVCELRMRRMDGTTFWAREEATTAEEADGSPICRVVLSDITARKQAEEILGRDKRALENLVKRRSSELVRIQAELGNSKRLSDIGVLAATVAHELRNPLFGIDLAMTIIRRKPADARIEPQLLAIEKLLTESDQIIDNLLSYSRLRPSRLRTLNPHALLGDCLDTLESARAAKSIALSRRIGSLQAVRMTADPVQVKEVFNNVLNNAADAVPDRGGEIRVTARVYREWIRIHVTDNGQGITKADLKRVFDPFFTNKPKGTGLGLTVCHQIVRMHGGSIRVRSEVGQGTTVTIALPKAPSESGAPGPASQPLPQEPVGCGRV